MSKTCSIVPGTLARSPDGDFGAGVAICIEHGKLKPAALHLRNMRTGRVEATDLGTPSPAMAGFWGDRTLALLLAREVDGTNQLSLWLHDAVRNSGLIRSTVVLPPDLRFVRAIQGRECALIHAFASGASQTEPSRWFLANLDHLVALKIAATPHPVAYWLGGQEAFAVGERGADGVVRPVAMVSCQGEVSDKSAAELTIGPLDAIKSAKTKDIVVVGHNDGNLDRAPTKRSTPDGVQFIELYGVLRQDFAVSDDGEMLAVGRSQGVVVYRSSDLSVVAMVPSVDTDQDIIITAEPPAITFADDHSTIHSQSFEAAK